MIVTGIGATTSSSRRRFRALLLPLAPAELLDDVDELVLWATGLTSVIFPSTVFRRASRR